MNDHPREYFCYYCGNPLKHRRSMIQRFDQRSGKQRYSDYYFCPTLLRWYYLIPVLGTLCRAIAPHDEVYL